MKQKLINGWYGGGLCAATAHNSISSGYKEEQEVRIHLSLELDFDAVLLFAVTLLVVLCAHCSGDVDISG